MKIWLDDERDPREWLPSKPWYAGGIDGLEEWIWVRSAWEAISLLARRGVDEVSLDQNLEPEDGKGYDVLLAIEWWAFEDPNYEPPRIHVHTDDVNSDTLMLSAVRGIESILARREGSSASVPPLLAERLPLIADDVEAALTSDHLLLARQVPFLRITSRCACGETWCQTVNVEPTGERWESDLGSPGNMPITSSFIVRTAKEGTVKQIEIHDRPDLESLLEDVPRRERA